MKMTEPGEASQTPKSFSDQLQINAMQILPEDLNCFDVVDGHNISISQMAIPIVLLGIVDVCIIFGNGLVIAAVLGFRQLRSVNCYFIASLAFADLSLAIFILPFSTAFEALDQIWIFGDVWCQIWLIVDVFLCTASIYNLVAISIDRYIAIKRPLNYPAMVTHTKGKSVIALVWILALSVCLPSVNWFTPADTEKSGCECTPLNNSPGYIIFSSIASFYLPMVIIFLVYAEIFKIARRSAQMRRNGVMSFLKNSKKKRAKNKGGLGDIIREARKNSTDCEMRVHGGHKSAEKAPPSRYHDDVLTDVHAVRYTAQRLPHMAVNSMVLAPLLKENETKQRLRGTCEAGRMSRMSAVVSRARSAPATSRYLTELRAVKTVAIVTGCFVFCWLGFAVCYTMQAFPACRKQEDCVDKNIFGIVFWLGYLNSAINPIIYALFNREFRNAFKKILRCRIHESPVHRFKLDRMPTSSRNRISTTRTSDAYT